VAAREASFMLPKRFDGATAPAFSRLPFRKLAMLPAATPAGRAAAEALDATGIFDDVEERFVQVPGPDAARGLLDSGGAEAAIVPLSLAVSWDLPFSAIDPSLHAPLRVSAGVVSASKSKDAARRALEAAVSPEAREIWKRFGYRAP
jgi:molybdate transport system substrate-binding protein